MTVLRVGLGTTMIEPDMNGGRLDGIGVYTRALLSHLEQAGCAVRPYSFPRVGRGGAPHVGRPLPRSFEAASVADLLAPRTRMHMPADLFHATDYRIVRMDCPVVATLHDALPIQHPEWCSARLRGAKNYLQKKAARKADHVIAVSSFAVRELVQCFGVDERRISVVHNGVGDAWLQASDADATDATLRALALRRGYFLAVGTLQPRKNIERVLAAYLGLPSAVRAARALVIVGSAGWRSEALLRQIAAARQNGEAVVWLGALADEARLRHVYAGAAVLVFASLYEGFGIPVLEAFASRVPVIASNTTSLPEVTQGAALEVDPLSVGQIGEAMLALARDDALRTRCIAAGYRIAQRLTWRATALRTAAVYRAVLSH